MLQGREGTIFALATGGRKAALAVFRISGQRTGEVVRKIAGSVDLPERKATLRTLRDPASAAVIDQGLITWFKGPASFTGEDVVEISVTGGRAVVAAMIRALRTVPGMRPADPGEFAYRALLNGKLDLSSVEGLADLIDAETEQQRVQAQKVAGGALWRECEAIRESLIDALVGVEAQIDFSEEEDVGPRLGDSVKEAIKKSKTRIESALATASNAMKLRDGFLVVLAGPPNVGKSTLMNALVGRDVSITSAAAGTTRDLVETFMDVKGLPIVFVDSAGVRESSDPVEREGIERALSRAGGADLVLWLHDDRPFVRAPFVSEAILEVRTKADIKAAGGGHLPAPASLSVCAIKGEGIDELLEVIVGYAERSMVGAEPRILIGERQRLMFEDARQALCAAWEADEPELIAEDIRHAVSAIERVTGRAGTEDVLDLIFSRMCIGK